MLMDFDRGTIQHQSRFIHNVLGNQFLKNVLLNTLLAPSAEPGVHAFPRAVPLRQVPPWDPCIQPVQISHWASSCCLFPAFLHALAFLAATSFSLFSTILRSLFFGHFILLLYHSSLLLSTFVWIHSLVLPKIFFTVNQFWRIAHTVFHPYEHYQNIGYKPSSNPI